MILDSREKLEFYREKMQELVSIFGFMFFSYFLEIQCAWKKNLILIRTVLKDLFQGSGTRMTDY